MLTTAQLTLLNTGTDASPSLMSWKGQVSDYDVVRAVNDN